MEKFNVPFYACIALMLMAVIMILLPPRFNNPWQYGIRTKNTIKNSTAWKEGQKIFAYMLFATAGVFSIFSYFLNNDKKFYLIQLLLLIVFSKLIKIAVNKMLAKKYPDLIEH